MLVGRYPALLDACILHPAFVRGALLWYADERLFQPRWTTEILDEWTRSLQRRFPDMTSQQLAQKTDQMNLAYPDALIDGYQPFVDALELPDPDDRHVLAAAIVGKCNGLITANLRDFPSEIAEPLAIEVVHPDDFIVNIIDLHPSRALAACKRHRRAMTKAKPTAEQFLQYYEQAGLIQSHARLTGHIELL